MRNKIYKLLSKDSQIKKFNEFHLEDAKTLLLFLMQIGNSKVQMVQNLKNIIELHQKICQERAYLAYLKSLNKAPAIQSNINDKIIKKYIKEYKKLILIISKYLKKIDTSENHEFIDSFNSLILYEKIIQELYENKAKTLK